MSFLLKNNIKLYIIKIGDNMKKIFNMLIALFIIYIGIQIAFAFFSKGYEYEYEVFTNDTDYKVKEKMMHKVTGEIDNYYFEIEYNNDIFYYQTLNSFNSANHIITNIYSYSDDEYNCILPTLKNNSILTDIMCKKDNVITFYHDIKNANLGLISFAKSLSSIGYDSSNWDDDTASEQIGSVSIYKDNLISNHYLSLSNYKGLYILKNNKVDSINLFSSDNYKQTLATTVNEFYVVADYNSKYRFSKFFVVNLTNNRIDEITFDTEISFDSYIQGIHNDSFYIFDRNNKKQYEINVRKKNLLEIGNEQLGIKIYNHNEVEWINAADAKNKDILFNNQSIDNENYDKVYKIGGDESGFYYLFKKDNNKYKAYRSNIQNSDQLTYLFDTTDVERIIYKDNIIYYLNGDTINSYRDINGTKKIFKYNELTYNLDLKFDIYSQ